MSQVKTFSLFTDFDIDLFKAGKHFRLYEKFGISDCMKSLVHILQPLTVLKEHIFLFGHLVQNPFLLLVILIIG